jgi:aminoglycoside phosphotransferase (APT) family kinase protein
VGKELALLPLLAREGAPTPTVEHADPTGSVAGRPFLLMASAGGATVLDSATRPGPEGERLFGEMGEILALIHGITFPDSGDLRPEGRVPIDEDEQRRRVRALGDWAEAQEYLDAAAAGRFRALPFPSWQGHSLCHRDFHAVQCVVSGGRIRAVVDWESAWAANAAIDLALTHAYLDSYAPDSLVRAFFAGDTSVRPLPEDYAALARPVRLAQALALARVWHGQRRPGLVRRAIELYRSWEKA